MKPVLMIHEFKREYLTLPLKDYTLTFDDGRVSPFHFWSELKDIPTQKIFFIITSACRDGFEGKPPVHYLSEEMIRFLMKQKDVTIGGHSHYHKHIKDIQGLRDKVTHIKQDTSKMLDWFSVHLQFRPDHFCFPYNEEDDIYRTYLKIEGFTHIYGKGRVDIDKLSP